MGRKLNIYHHIFCIIFIWLFACLRLPYCHANVLPVDQDHHDQASNQGVDLKNNLNAGDNGKSQSQLLDAHAVPPNVLLAPDQPSSLEANSGVDLKSVAGQEGPSEGGKAGTGNMNDLLPTKDDWFYNPDDEGNEDMWDDESSYEDEDLDNPASAAPPGAVSVVDDEDEEDEDDEDDTNYELWAKLQSKYKEQNDEEEEEKDGDGAQLEQDFDEKLLDDVVDEDLVKKNKPPTAPSKMVLFYTWMILALLIMVIGISTYQARCRSLHMNGFRHQTREDRKRLVDHEYT